MLSSMLLKVVQSPGLGGGGGGRRERVSFYIPYSGKLSREKTFANFMVL